MDITEQFIHLMTIPRNQSRERTDVPFKSIDRFDGVEHVELHQVLPEEDIAAGKVEKGNFVQIKKDLFHRHDSKTFFAWKKLIFGLFLKFHKFLG